MNIAFLHLGSNLGDRQKYLSDASMLIARLLGKIIEYSPVYETVAWGNKDQNDFLNQAIKIQTIHSPQDLMDKIHIIEQNLGRKKEIKWGPRVIDIDIIFYEDMVIDDPGLQIPHPYLAERNFVLEPLKDIAPDFLHPVLNKTVDTLYKMKNDQTQVKLLSD